MKASELAAQLQQGIDEGRDWEVIDPISRMPLDTVTWHMPPLRDREDWGAEPCVVITREA